MEPFTVATARNLDLLRTAVWLVRVMLRAEVGSADALEREIQRRLERGVEKSGNLRRYVQGRAPCFKRGSGPRLRMTVWPERAEQFWPGTLPWVMTPFWYLLEATPTAQVLLECVFMLPEHLQEDLLTHLPEESAAKPELAFLSEHAAYELARQRTPFALGALACGMHWARLSADYGTERRFAVAITWMLFEFAQCDGPLRPHFYHLLNYFLLCCAQRNYPPGICLPMDLAEVQRYHARRQAYLDWDPTEQESPW